MNALFRLSPDDRVELAGNSYRLLRQMADGFVLQGLADARVRVSYKNAEFRDLLAQGGARLFRRGLSAGRSEARLKGQQDFLALMPAMTRNRVLWRQLYCNAFLQAEGEGKVTRNLMRIGRVLPDLHAKVVALTIDGRYCGKTRRADGATDLPNRPSASTLLRWVKTYEEGGMEVLSLLPRSKRGDGGETKLSPQVERLIARGLGGYLDNRRPTRRQIVDDIKALFVAENNERLKRGLDPLPPPSRRTIERRIRALDPFTTYAARYSVEAAKRKFSLFETGVDATEPLERVEIDEWQVDLITLFAKTGLLEGLSPKQLAEVERGRRWLYVAIDCATRCVVGMRLARSANPADAIRTIEDVTRSKTDLAIAAGCESPWDQHGGLVHLVADQGAAFRSEAFRTAVTDIGATIEFPPAGTPQMRGTVERIFGTIKTGVMPLLTGRTFSNSVERGDHDGGAASALTDDDLIRALVLYIVDVYHNRPYGSLNGETPANCWARLSKDTPPYASPDRATRLAVFGVEVSRAVSGIGVTVMNVPYTCDALRQLYLHGCEKTVKVRVDPENLGSAAVRIGRDWVFAQAVLPDMEGVSAADWRAAVTEFRIRNHRASSMCEATVRTAIEKIRKITDDAMKLARLTPQLLTAADIKGAEDEVFIGLSIDTGHRPVVNIPSLDLFGDTIPTGPRKAGDKPIKESIRKSAATPSPSAVRRTSHSSSDEPKPTIIFEED